MRASVALRSKAIAEQIHVLGILARFRGDVRGESLRRRTGPSNMAAMSRASIAKPRSPLIPSEGERQALRTRVGEFLRARRLELGLSQGDITRSMGYVSLNSVSNLETGREGLPAKRIYAWADILQLPRDAFFRFATGETEKMERPRAAVGI